MKRLLILAVLVVLPAVGLMAEAPPPIKAGRITKDLVNEKPPKPPQSVCFKPGDVSSFSYRTNNSLRINTSAARSYDVSFFVKCGGLATTKAVSFDGLMEDQVCGTGIESVIFYSAEQGPKRCAIRDVTSNPLVARANP